MVKRLALLLPFVSVACAVDAEAPDVQKVDEDVAVLADDVSVADAQFVRDVEVTDDTLVVPKRGNEHTLSSLHAGVVLVGDRSTAKGSKNPYGFARRVKRQTTKGNEVTLTTERVAFADLFQRAKFKLRVDDTAASHSSIATRDVGTPPNGEPARLSKYGIGGLSYGYDTKIKTLGDQTADVKITVSDAYAYVDPTGASISLEKDGVMVKTLSADLPFRYDAGLSVCGELSVEKTYDSAIGDKALEKTLLDQDIATVTVFVGGVPVVVSLHAKVDVWCSVDVSGKATIAGRFRTRGAPALHVAWDGGWTSSFDEGGPQNFGTVDAEAAASAALTCGANGKMGVYLYDTIGLYATLKPSVTLKASTGAGTAGAIADRTSMCLGMDGDIATQVGVEAKVLSEQIFDRNTTPWQKHFEIFDKCENRDSCAGRPAGWYCSDLAPYSAFECDENQSIVRGSIPCDTTMLCKRTGPSRTDPAAMGPQPADPNVPPTPVCVAAQAPEVEARVLECPTGQVPLEQHTAAAQCANGDGFSCDSDPVTGRDRACCNGQCVIFAESACDASCRCYGEVAGVDVGERKCGETVCGSDNVLWRCEGTMTDASNFSAQTSYVSTFEACPATCACEGGVDQSGNQVGPKACGASMCGHDQKMWTCDAATKTWTSSGERCP